MRCSSSLFAVVPVCLAVPLAGCTSFFTDPGPATTQDRAVDDLTAVELRTGGSLTVTSGDGPALRVTAGQDVIDRLTSEVSDGTLVLDSDGSGRFGSIRYDLVVPRLDALTVSGSGDVSLTDVPADDLQISVEGSGDVSAIGVAAASVGVRVRGSGDVRLDGTADDQDVEIQGSGDYLAAGLATRTAAVSIAGSGDAEVQVSDRLDADIAGSGDVVYSGDAEVHSSVAGSGDVRSG